MTDSVFAAIIPGMAPRARLFIVLLIAFVAICAAIAALSLLPEFRPSATPSPTALPPTPTLSPTPPMPTATDLPETILQSAERSFAYGNWAEAAALAQSVQTLLPKPLADSARLLAAQSQFALGNSSEAIGLLEGAEFADSGRETAALNLLAAAYRETGDSLKAIEKQTEMLAATGVLTGWIHQLNGDAYLQLGDVDKAMESYRLAETAAQGANRLRLLEKIAEVQMKAHRGADALETYTQILELSATSEMSAKIHYLMGLALREQQREDAAMDEFLKATDASTTARESYFALVELVNAGRKVDEFRRGLIGYQSGAYQAAIQGFERYLDGDNPSKVADAWYYIGLAQLSLGEHEAALAALEESLASAPDAPFRAKVLMSKGRVLARAGRWGDARETYRRAQADCPACDAAPEALWRSAEAALAQGDRAGAASDFLWFQRNYPQDSGADDAMFSAAPLYYSDARYDEVVAACEELLKRYPDSNLSAAAHFWAAKGFLQSRRQLEAVAHLTAAAENPSPDYYTLRASAVLRGDTTILPPIESLLLEASTPEERDEFLAWFVSWANKGEAYDFDTLPENLAGDPDYHRGEALALLGMSEEAAAHFSSVRARWKDAPLVLLQLAERLRDLGLYQQSIACAERVLTVAPGDAPLQSLGYLQKLAYPVYYADLVLEQASLNGLDALLVFAVIRQESRFDPVASSWAGAMGLMQVIPPTGEWVALRLGIRDFQKGDLLRPAVNVRFGTWYLGQQMRDFSNDLLVALAAYNGGPGYTRLWLSQMVDYDPDLFAESIPVAETRTYVKAILEQYAVYRMVYQPGHQPSR